MFYRPNEIPRKEAEDALRPAFDHSDVAEVETWVQRCIDDQAQLWRLNDYWVISEVQDTKKGRAVHLAFSAGVYEPAVLAVNANAPTTASNTSPWKRKSNHASSNPRPHRGLCRWRAHV